MFKVGDEVLCVDKGSLGQIETGSIYKISQRFFLAGEYFVRVKKDSKAEFGHFHIKLFIPNTPEAKAKWMRKRLEEE